MFSLNNKDEYMLITGFFEMYCLQINAKTRA